MELVNYMTPFICFFVALLTFTFYSKVSHISSRFKKITIATQIVVLIGFVLVVLSMWINQNFSQTFTLSIHIFALATGTLFLIDIDYRFPIYGRGILSQWVFWGLSNLSNNPSFELTISLSVFLLILTYNFNRIQLFSLVTLSFGALLSVFLLEGIFNFETHVQIYTNILLVILLSTQIFGIGQSSNKFRDIFLLNISVSLLMYGLQKNSLVLNSTSELILLLAGILMLFFSYGKERVTQFIFLIFLVFIFGAKQSLYPYNSTYVLLTLSTLSFLYVKQSDFAHSLFLAVILPIPFTPAWYVATSIIGSQISEKYNLLIVIVATLSWILSFLATINARKPNKESIYLVMPILFALRILL